MRAEDLVDDNESAIVVFTRGTKLHIGADGNGTTGDWVTSPKRELDKVVIYHRGAETNEVYVATYVGMDPKPSPKGRKPPVTRHIIRFTDARRVGTTGANWPEFAGEGQNPVRYIEHRS